MNNKLSFSLETEAAICKACTAITMRNNAELLLELWDRGLVPDDVFIRSMKYETGLPVDLYKKET